VWQALQDELKDHAFTVFAVALDEPDAARPWIEAAKATYPCVIDRDHVVAELYGFVNVPQAVWIDEAGRIVRPPETAGSTDSFRSVNRQTGVVPPEALAHRDLTKRRYLDAVRDWVRNGAASAHAMDEAQASAAMPQAGHNVALAHAHFRLGRYLCRVGMAAEGEAHIAKATGLHPESWAMWRQAAAKNERGLAAGPEFWARVDALGERPYYPPARVGDA
jgi:hypothetical protein